MKSVGIIAEYNPFHNGHLYQINKVKEMFKDYTIIVVMSGNFTQKCDLSMNKFNKAKIALENGVDLVIELPFIYAVEGADIFSKGAINILKELKVDNIVFGSELNDINVLYNLASTQINNKLFDEKVKKYLDLGNNYPTSISLSLKDIIGFTTKEPNDILGITYIKEIILQNANIKPYSIKRTNDYNSLELNSNIVSASAIRNALKNNIDVSNYIPNYDLDSYHYIDEFYDLLKYKIITSSNLNIYQSVDEGIEFRIKKYINECNSLEELIDKCKTKRYTYNKIKRILLHILCDFTKEEANKRCINYIRVLGFNNNGKKYLNSIKKDINIPILTKYNDLLYIESRVTNIYNIIVKGKEEYKEKIVII